ncbi:hypothetical protein O181_083745, partial [Austropuccinia psidii MF-1]|nr:hypothetical protein [Austropuccinia psidii MF-1]
MSTSKPRKSHSRSVHDSDSKSSIEYVQTQSPLSPNIPFTTPITSSINVSGLNIDVFEGPGSTPEISSRPNPQSKFPCEFLLNCGRNAVASQDPFEQSKQPTLNIPSGSQAHVGNEKQADGKQQKRPLENVTRSGLLEGNPGLRLHQSDEFYASSTLVHKEKVTGRHHPYASKPRMGHSISSREKIVDDEDENMSPTQSERNDEPRKENFTAHEQGTQSNTLQILTAFPY